MNFSHIYLVWLQGTLFYIHQRNLVGKYFAVDFLCDMFIHYRVGVRMGLAKTVISTRIKTLDEHMQYDYRPNVLNAGEQTHSNLCIETSCGLHSYEAYSLIKWGLRLHSIDVFGNYKFMQQLYNCVYSCSEWLKLIDSFLKIKYSWYILIKGKLHETLSKNKSPTNNLLFVIFCCRF